MQKENWNLGDRRTLLQRLWSFESINWFILIFQAFVAKGNMANMLPGLVEQMLLAACSKDGITLDFKDEGIAGISLEELSDEEDDVNGDDIDISLSANSNDLDNIKSINVENAYKEEKETAIAMLKVST